MATTARPSTLTSAQSRYVLERLIDEGRVSAAEVKRLIAGMREEMSFIEKRLAELRALSQPMKHPIRAAKRVAPKIRKAKRNLSAKTRASYQLQGQFLGYLKQIPTRQRARYKRMAKKEGREKAVASMKRALGK